MTFDYPLPWWAVLVVTSVAAGLAYRAYARPIVPLARRQQRCLMGLRLSVLLLLLALLLRPVILEPSRSWRNAIVPVLVDTSRSMRIADASGQRRIDRAANVLRRTILPQLSREFQVDLLAFGEALEEASLDRLSADGRRSDLTGALRAVEDRYRGRTLAGIVVISDGGETGGQDTAATVGDGGPAVYSVGVGARRIGRDREVLSLTAGEAALAGSIVELDVALVSHGFEGLPAEVRVLENGRPVHVRRVRSVAEGVPVRESFLVSPKAEGATLYTVEIPTDPRELVRDNNSRGVLVRPPGPRRRVLLVEGAPGFEHSFLKRALDEDMGLEVDSVVRKGQNDRGEDTFYVQAPASRGGALASGYPRDREALFFYDAVVFGNVEADFFTHSRLAMAADFVAARGGGLLVLGARSFTGRSFANTPLEEVLPVEVSGRGGVIRARATAGELNKLELTSEGEIHPVTRMGVASGETRQRWSAAAPLAAVAAVGGRKPGASILAVAAGGDGVRPVLAVQQYGRGRAMVFAGEGSWRWRMMAPVADRTYETFWRQAVRWLATAAPGPVTIAAPGGSVPGDVVALDVHVRDGRYEPARDATVRLRVTGPDGTRSEFQPVLADASSGRHTAQFRPDRTGVYHVQGEARRGSTVLGTAEEWILVGGADPELADPRLNDEVLRRLAIASGGRFLDADDAGLLATLFRAARPQAGPPARRDLWHGWWTFAAVVLLLSVEWSLRRRWGLR